MIAFRTRLVLVPVGRKSVDVLPCLKKVSF